MITGTKKFASAAAVEGEKSISLIWKPDGDGDRDHQREMNKSFRGKFFQFPKSWKCYFANF